MKFVLLLAMVCFSSVTFSQELTSDKNEEIIRAIKDSLASKDLDCHESVKGGSLKASTLNFDLISSFKASISINESQQPVITFKGEDSKQLFVVEISTNEAQTIVEKISIENSSLKTTTKNVGTIINPVYKQVIIKELYENIECK